MQNKNSNFLLLSELIATRISHDIAGVASAVSNGVEFLSGGDDFADEAQKLITESSNTINARIRFFRTIFGISDRRLANSENAKKELFDFASKTTENSINIDWNIFLNNHDEAEFLNRLILLLNLTAIDCIPRGGDIEIKAVENNIFTITIVSEKLTIPTDMNETIKSLAEQKNWNDLVYLASPRVSPLLLALARAEEKGFKILVEILLNKLQISITC